MRAYCAILAGGTGSRMGADMPKQFLPLLGVPIIIRTIWRVLECKKFENPDGDKHLPRKVYWKILRSELTIKGVWNSSYTSAKNEWREVLNVLEAKQDVFARLITSTFALSEGLGAFAKMKNGSKLEIKGMFINE